MNRGRWFLIGVVGAIVIAVVAALVVNAVRDDKHCVNVTLDTPGPDLERTPEDALNDYLANHEEPLPLGGWAKTSDVNGVATFTSSAGGSWTVQISTGEVRSYSGCS